VLLVVGMLYGLAAADRELPPFGVVRGVYRWARLQVLGEQPASAIDETVYEAGGDRGRFNTLRQPSAGAPSAEDEKRFEQLAALGYLSGYEVAGDRQDVTFFDPLTAEAGLNLYTSGHGPEAILIDMQGRVLHKWRFAFDDAFPNRPGHEREQTLEYWRRVHLAENGDLLAMFADGGLIKIDKDSNLLWATPGRFHHKILVEPGDGTIYSLLRDERLVPWIHPERPILDDYIVILSAEGEIRERISILDALAESSYASLLANIPDMEDILHTNSIEVLTGVGSDRVPALRRGNFLISIRRLNTVAVVDADSRKVVWALTGQWIGQHEPTLLPSGNLLLFDNRGNYGRSKVIEIDPLTQETVWEYAGTEENGFFSATCGAVQRLANGNTLITESDGGRAFEVTPHNDLAWEFITPHRAGENGDLAATLFEMLRLESVRRDTWLGSFLESATVPDAAVDGPSAHD